MRSWIAQSDSFKCPNCSKTFQRSSIDENPDAWAADQVLSRLQDSEDEDFDSDDCKSDSGESDSGESDSGESDSGERDSGEEESSQSESDDNESKDGSKSSTGVRRSKRLRITGRVDEG